MAQAELFVAFLAAIVLVALAARRVERIPHAVALVIGGIVAGILPFAPEIRLDPDVIFVVFLPPILYPSSFTFALEDVRANLRPIGLLAFGLVVVTIFALAAAAHLIAGLPWTSSFVLGAVLAPTDPVAATAVIRSSGAPGRLATILEGESLINDGTSLTALKISIAAVGGSFSAAGAVGDFVVVALGGAALGAVLGWLTVQVRRRLDELELEATIAVLLAYGAFILAERLGVSGVLAVVAAGYVMGRSADVATPGTRLRAEAFWAVAQFLAESILFLLVGLAFAQILDDPATRDAAELAAIAGLLVVATLVTRLLWMFTVPYLAGLIASRRRLDALVGARERAVLGFAGLRGALSVAAALSIPSTVSGAEFAERGTVVAVAIAAIVVLLVLPALGLPVVLRALGLTGADDTDDRARRIRRALAEAALARTEEIAVRESVPERVVSRVRERYELQLDRDSDSSGDDGTWNHAAYRDLQRAAVEAQRARLDELRRDGEVHGELLRSFDRELDVALLGNDQAGRPGPPSG